MLIIIMQQLPDDVIGIILGFLPDKDLTPITNVLKSLYRSNLVWKPRVLKRFGQIESNNYFGEYIWGIKLEHSTFMYKRAYTYGCVGKKVPLIKPIFPPAIYDLN